MRKSLLTNKKTNAQTSYTVTVHLISILASIREKVQTLLPEFQNFQQLAVFCVCAVQYMSDLVENPDGRFSQNETDIIFLLEL